MCFVVRFVLYRLMSAYSVISCSLMSELQPIGLLQSAFRILIVYCFVRFVCKVHEMSTQCGMCPKVLNCSRLNLMLGMLLKVIVLI
jgi:hypothetical protein